MEFNDPLTERIIGCAIEVHRSLGPGLLEKAYRKALCVEFDFAQITYEYQRHVPVFHRGVIVGDFYPDFVIERQVVVEVKCTSAHEPYFDAQTLSYLRLTKAKRALLLNFGRSVMKDGIKRFVL
jgi:GxxExxY protein